MTTIAKKERVQMDILCKNRCGFRVHEGYFKEKPRFMPGICPRCNSEVEVVEAFTNTVLPERHVELNPASQNYGKVV